MFAEHNENQNRYRSKLNTRVKDLDNHQFKVDLIPFKQRKIGEDERENEEDRNQIPQMASMITDRDQKT
jgi:hypothetical protein